MRGSRAEIAALPEEAVKGVRRTGTGDEALVLRTIARRRNRLTSRN